MGDVINKIEKVFIKKEGFKREVFFSGVKGGKVLLLTKEFKEGIYGIVLTNDKEEVVDYNEALNYLSGKGVEVTLNIIIEVQRNTYIPSNLVNNKIIVDKDNGRILYKDRSCEDLLPLIELCGKKTVGNLNEFQRYYLTYSFIIVNVLLFLICAYKSRNLMDMDAYVLLEMGAKYGPIMVWENQWWRLLSATFLHGGLIHLAFNMYALYYLGRQIEEVYGRVSYGIIYFLAGIGGSYLSYYLAPNTLSIGASGAIFGLLGALLVYAFVERGRVQQGVFTNLLLVIGLNLALGFSSSNIDNYGHIGGLIIGTIASFIIYNIIKGNKK